MKTRTALVSTLVLTLLTLMPASGFADSSGASGGSATPHLSSRLSHQKQALKGADGKGGKGGKGGNHANEKGTGGKGGSGFTGGDHGGGSGDTGGGGGGGGGGKNRFTVRSGFTLTDPQNSRRYAIKTKIMKAINHAPGGSKLRFMSWNFDSRAFADALIRAHERGASVRIFMARTLLAEQAPGSAYHHLIKALQEDGNAKRKPAMRSWARTCDHSCRGRGGAMHSKYFVFSQSGASKDIVMQTSANLTGAANAVQWNEMFTTVGREVTYDTYMKVFDQAGFDKPQKPILVHDGSITDWFFPRPGQSNIALDLLHDVKCSGVRGAGLHGHTVVRVGMDVFIDSYGLNVIKKLLDLQNHGCDVKVVYAQAVGDAIKGVMSHLPNNHLVVDRNGDGQYDRYLHTKLVAISGRVGDDRAAHVVMDGSANFSGVSLASDEQGMIIYRKSTEKAYSRYIDQMFNTHLTARPTVDARRTTIGPVDPYALMED